MKFLRITIFAVLMIAGMSFTAMAQKDDKKPKNPPPTVTPGRPDKPPKGNPPKEDKPKKPETSWFLFAKAGSGEEKA